MNNLALWVRLEAKKGKEAEVEKFLRDAQSLVENEPDTISWYAIRMGPSTFGIFDTFHDEMGRNEHLSGQVAKALSEKATELFSQPPSIQKIDVIASKLPEMTQY
jgi:quinol monooxygenase YgiN